MLRQSEAQVDRKWSPPEPAHVLKSLLVSLHPQFSRKPFLTKVLTLGGQRLRLCQTLGWDADDTSSHTWHPVHPVGCSPTFGPPTHSPIFLWSCSCHWLPFCWHPEGLPATQTADGQEKRAGAHITQRKNACNGQTVWSERRVADTWLLVR